MKVAFLENLTGRIWVPNVCFFFTASLSVLLRLGPNATEKKNLKIQAEREENYFVPE